MTTYQYKPTIVAKVLEILESNLGSAYKAYFNGTPQDIPSSQMPAIGADIVATDYDLDATGRDKRTHTIMLRIILNRGAVKGVAKEEEVVQTDLYNRVQGLDDTTGKYAADSLIYALRTNFTVNNTVIQNIVGVEFRDRVRGQERTIEADIGLTLEELVDVDSRV